jgi:hypothetical protein
MPAPRLLLVLTVPHRCEVTSRNPEAEDRRGRDNHPRKLEEYFHADFTDFISISFVGYRMGNPNRQHFTDGRLRAKTLISVL